VTRPVRAVIFDLGHTVWNYAPTPEGRKLGVLRVHARLQNELGDLTPHPRQLERALMKSLEKAIVEWYADLSLLQQPPSSYFIRTALSALEFPVDEAVIADLTEIIFGAEPDIPTVPPDTVAALATLQAAGIAMGCITNTMLLQHAIEDVLVRLGLVRYFDAVIVSSEAGYRKPHASLFQRALRELDVTAGEALFVGDRLFDDVSGAKAAGMRAALTHQYRQEDPREAQPAPDAVVRRLREVPLLVAEGI
jgi:putative hydrolase of the HAD superfamily